MPVFNRLPLTQRMVDCLRAQKVLETLEIVVIDDGSTDGTGEWLAERGDITVLKGDGTLWWGGAIQRGLHYAFGKAAPSD